MLRNLDCYVNETEFYRMDDAAKENVELPMVIKGLLGLFRSEDFWRVMRRLLESNILPTIKW